MKITINTAAGHEASDWHNTGRTATVHGREIPVLENECGATVVADSAAEAEEFARVESTGY